MLFAPSSLQSDVSRLCQCVPRNLRVDNLSVSAARMLVRVVLTIGNVVCPPVETIESTGSAQLYFHDSRDAAKAVAGIKRVKMLGDVKVVYQLHGEVSVCILDRSIGGYRDSLFYALSQYGEINQFDVVPDSLAGFKAECFFHDVRAAHQACERPIMVGSSALTGIIVSVPHSHVCGISDSPDSLTSPPSSRAWPSSLTPVSCETAPTQTSEVFGFMSPSALFLTNRSIWSPYKKSALSVFEGASKNNHFLKQSPVESMCSTPFEACEAVFSDAGSSLSSRASTPIEKLSRKERHKLRGKQVGTKPGPKPSPIDNNINLGVIASFKEYRTTVMIRNIPNKVDLAGFREFLDETNRHTYDFLYLRIDYNNLCNLGYAFVNFVSPMDILDFVKARCGRRWPGYAGDKIINACFANIQGRQVLIEKFRDSAVMRHLPEHRPKLFYIRGPNAGEEQPFPF